MKIRLSKAISWVGPEKKGVSKIFFLTFLTSYKHSMAKKSDRTHHSFSDPTLKRPSKDPIWSLREHKIGEHKSKVFQRSSRGIQDSREYVPLQEHSHGMHHASSRGHPLASRFLVYVPLFYVPLDNLSDSVYKKSTRSDTT